MSDTIERLLAEAEQDSEGIRVLQGVMQRAKELSNAAVFLALRCSKFAKDGAVPHEDFAFDSDCERYLHESLHAAETGVSGMRECVTNFYVAKLKEAGRVKT